MLMQTLTLMHRRPTGDHCEHGKSGNTCGYGRGAANCQHASPSHETCSRATAVVESNSDVLTVTLISHLPGDGSTTSLAV
jgi:hypothetical protein